MYSHQRILNYLLAGLLFHCTAITAGVVDDANSLEAVIKAGGKYVGVDVCKACHLSQHNQILQESHGQVSDVNSPFAMDSCETCHGPGEKHTEIIIGGLVAFTGVNPSSVAVQNTMCMQCHQDGTMIQWHDSLHEIEQVACTACHSMHKPSKVMDRTTESEVCYKCHNDIRAQTYQRSSHAIREGKLTCSDCHTAHGSNGPSMLRQLSLNDNCYDCHAEKRGPYLWEHYPATEDCSLCHKSHGSIHAFLLKKQGTQLCQQCHAQIGPDGTGHIRTFYDAWDKDFKRGRSFLGRNCANCHKAHGSNHPSGVNLLR